MASRSVLHYQLLEKIGAGGMGEVYKAQDSRLNRFVAVKLLLDSKSSSPEQRRRFIQEAQAASALNHPNIITIYDIVSDGDAQCIVMEYIGGKTLLDVIPNGGLRVPQVLQYSVQIADALSAAHAAGIVHRDLKPGNVMVTNSGLIKVLDFGLAKLIDRTPATQLDDTITMAGPALTVEGSIIGTLSYSSPEQVQGKKVDARSDIFSFGTVLYEMITGRRAFGGDSSIAILTAVLRDEPKPIAELAPDIPAQIEQIVKRCLQKDPDARWQSMGEVVAELTALKQQSDSGRLYKIEIPAPRRRFPKNLAFAALGMAVAAVGGWWWPAHHSSAPPPPIAQPAGQAPAAPAPPRSTDPVFTNETVPDPKRKSPALPAPEAITTPAESPAAPPVIPTAPVTAADALPFRIVLDEDIPAGAEEGQSLRFVAANDVSVSGASIIAKGAVVTGEIAEVGKKKFLRGGKLTFRLVKADAVDGQKLKVRNTPTRGAAGAPRRPVENGKGPRPKDIAAARGTEYIAYIDGDQTVSVRRDSPLL